jgi:hypothetical protein
MNVATGLSQKSNQVDESLYWKGKSMRIKLLSKTKIILLCVLPAFLSICVTCSLTRVVPIQIARVSQTEFFTQKFDFEKKEDIEKQDKNVDKIFTKLLGPKNWQNLKDHYGVKEIRDELIKNEMEIKSFMNFSIYIDPREQKEFLVEGTGRYFLIRKNGAIILTGDALIPLERHKFSEIDKGSVVIGVKIIISRVPNLTTYDSKSWLKYKIYFDTSMKEDRVYSIDYYKNHEVYLCTKDTKEECEDKNGKTLSNYDRLGNLIFQNAGKAKLWDFRGIELLRNDYKKLWRRSHK